MRCDARRLESTVNWRISRSIIDNETSRQRTPQGIVHRSDKYLRTLGERAAALSLRLDLVFRDALASACITPDGADVWRVNRNIARVENRNAVRAWGHPR